MGLTVFDLFHKLLSNSIGNSIDDLKYNYTIDQVYLMYEKCVREELDNYRMNATVFANSLIYTSPNVDAKGKNSVNRMWTKFMDTLSWNKIKEKNKAKSVKAVLTSFKRAGIPISKKKVTK